MVGFPDNKRNNSLSSFRSRLSVIVCTFPLSWNAFCAGWRRTCTTWVLLAPCGLAVCASLVSLGYLMIATTV